ncbi:fimbria/pilus periplasmic chaperone [Erwinia sp. CPCC 100877]|nr:fimbria/pilus periplasmic chaperone [Erwinia sp. CPCC 100877]
MRKLFCLLLGSVLLMSEALAGGVGLGATRLIYPDDARQATLNIRNTDRQSPFLIQSWIDDARGNKSSDFVITPPLFVLKPESENTLRVMFTASGLPQDRETLYWLTAKAIPHTPTHGKNTLQLASANRIKLFYRPSNLPISSEQAWGQLSGSIHGDRITLNNPTPYHITLISLQVQGGKEIQGVMVPPKQNLTLPGHYPGARSFSYRVINDFGAWSKTYTATLQ